MPSRRPPLFFLPQSNGSLKPALNSSHAWLFARSYKKNEGCEFSNGASDRRRQMKPAALRCNITLSIPGLR
jgi:hypothetical protein